jgi:hypothetical protein
MSGRVKWQRDGETVTGFRKTDRRQRPPRPLKERLRELAAAGIKPLPDGQQEVRLVFDLPASLQGLVSKGEHEAGLIVFPRGFVRITSWSAEKCFARAQAFFRDVARQRPGFTASAVIINTENPSAVYSRHLTIVRGALVVSAGLHEPKVFEAA